MKLPFDRTYLNSFFNAFKILRIFRILKKAKNMNKLFRTLKYVIPETFNLFILLVIIMMVFSLIGRDMFCYLKPQKNVGHSNIHFRNTRYSFLTLVRVLTGESWYLFNSDCSRRTQPNFVCFDIHNYEQYVKFGNQIFY